MRPRDNKKEEAIKRSAVELVVREGFDGLSMHKLARAAGVSVATIYIYFKDRDDLILSICREEMHRMNASSMKGFSAGMSFAEGLRVQWRNRARHWMKYPMESQFMERIRHSPYQDRAIAFVTKEFTDAMYGFVSRAIRKRELVELPIEIYWTVAYAPLYQLVKFHMDGVHFPGKKGFRLTQQKMDQTLELVLKALKP